MLQTKFHSGVYKYEEGQLEILPYFLYDISIYKLHKNRFNLLDNKVYTSNKFLNVKTIEVLKSTKNYKIIRFIDLLGAPLSFIKENNLPVYELTFKRKKNEKGKN